MIWNMIEAAVMSNINASGDQEILAQTPKNRIVESSCEFELWNVPNVCALSVGHHTKEQCLCIASILGGFKCVRIL